MRIKRNIIPKVLCGLAVALAVTNLPLPALADNEPSAITTDTVINTATDTTTPLTLTDSETPAASTLQVPEGDTSNAAGLTGTEVDQAADIPTTTIGVANNTDSQARSGDAEVSGNETGGDATTGNATAEATVINVANGNGLTAGDFTTFQCDVTEDTQENLVIDPSSLLPICKTTTVGSSTQPSANTQGLQTGASLVDILNNIALSAVSGDATVADNETAGSATTGDATALANIVNIANSAISADKSFLGVINIRANLTGNILVPQSLVDSLIGSASSGHPIDTTSITNTISANAASGNATVADNETAGSAASGDAATSVTVFNLTGQKVVAKNSLLVFVNILGKWTGVIVPAPGSSQTALLGSSIQQNPAASDYSQAGDTATRITNNISVDARSGDAEVSGNETGGDATTGNARAGVNLLNITNSEFLLDDWFGALFINVLGSWIGNFDIQAAIQPPANGQPPQVVQAVQVYQFNEPAAVTPPTPSRPAAASAGSTDNQIAGTENIQPVTPAGKVLSASDSEIDNQSDQSYKFDIFGLGIVVLSLTALIATSTMAIRHWYGA